MPDRSLPKHYDPSEVEPRWLQIWLSCGYVHADPETTSVPYAITPAAAQCDRLRSTWAMPSAARCRMC